MKYIAYDLPHGETDTVECDDDDLIYNSETHHWELTEYGNYDAEESVTHLPRENVHYVAEY